MYGDDRTRRDIRKLFGARVKALREERGLGRLELGRRSGMSDLEVGFIENGAKPVRLEDLVCLAVGLDVSPVAFFEGW